MDEKYLKARTRQDNLLKDTRELLQSITHDRDKTRINERIEYTKTLKKTFSDNHTELVAIALDDTKLAARSYYNNELKIEFEQLIEAIQKMLEDIQKEKDSWEDAKQTLPGFFEDDDIMKKKTDQIGKPSENPFFNLQDTRQKTDQSREIRDLQDQIKRLTTFVQQSQNNSPTTQTGAMGKILEEFKFIRNPLPLPAFPKKDVYKNYRQWLLRFKSFAKTNQLSDDLLVHHLRESVTNSPGESVVAQHTFAEDNYQEMMLQLHKRFYVIRNIALAYTEELIDLAKGTDTDYQKLRKVIDAGYSYVRNIYELVKESIIAGGNRTPTKDEILSKAFECMIVTLLSRTLDTKTRNYVNSALKLDFMEIPTINALLRALETRLTTIHEEEKKSPQKVIVANAYKVSDNKTKTTASPLKCVLCKGKDNHSTPRCFKIRKRSTPIKTKIDLLRKAAPSLCLICLKNSTGSCNCRQEANLCKCKMGRHHIILCSQFYQPLEKKEKKDKKLVANVVTVQNRNKYELLGTAELLVRDKMNRYRVMRTLLDDGSQQSMITEEAFHKLRLPSIKTEVAIRGTFSSKLFASSRLVTLHIQNRKRTLRNDIILDEYVNFYFIISK
jgi:hypothetical protein